MGEKKVAVAAVVEEGVLVPRRPELLQLLQPLAELEELPHGDDPRQGPWAQQRLIPPPRQCPLWPFLVA